MLKPSNTSKRAIFAREWRRYVLSVREEKQVHIVVWFVAPAFKVKPDQIYSPSRCVRRTALARQIAMYIAHIWLGLSLTEVGRRFGRDRTTVAYACHLMEDSRDNPIMNNMLDVMDSAVASWNEFSADYGGDGL